MEQITKIEYTEKRITSSYGSSNFVISYMVVTFNSHDNTNNTYMVDCKVSGIEMGDIELEIVNVIAKDNNENTLNAEDLGDLLGWYYINPTTELENTELVENLTTFEKQFIMAYFHSVSETLNFSTLIDVADCMKDTTIEQAKGIMGSLVKKGIMRPDADISESGHSTVGAGNKLFSIMPRLAKEFGYAFDGEDTEYEYLTPIQ